MARVNEPSGLRIDHDHPVVIASTKLDANGKLLVVVISSSISTPRPAGHITMESAAGGHSKTGLREPCVAKCDWHPRLYPHELGKQIGVMYPKSKMDLI